MKFPPAFSGNSANIYVVIETPKGSRNKYDYNFNYGFYELNKVLPAGLAFPLDFGFVPATIAEDGDPLDVLLISDEKTFTGCLVESRVIGVIKITQTERDGKTTRNDRVVAVSIVAHAAAHLKDVAELDAAFINEVTRFFEYYNTMAGKQLKIEGLQGATEALALVKKHHKAEKVSLWTKLFKKV